MTFSHIIYTPYTIKVKKTYKVFNIFANVLKVKKNLIDFIA